MNFKQKFIEEFKRLNPAQREAAEAIEGPVLVVAGPGTGKTQTMALRLANILQKTQAKPHNLLALTFTESGAIALKKRLASIIGPDAYRITASTFHAFAARLASMFPAEFATTRERLPIDELGQIQIFREILDKGDFPLLRPLRAPELYLRDLSKAISDLKREGVLPSRLQEIVEIEKEELSKQERINPRTKKPYGKILQAEKRIAKNLELANFYEEYQQILEERGFADYDDLILSVVEKLTHPTLSASLRAMEGMTPPTPFNKREATPPNPPLSGGETDNEFLLAYLQENFLYVTVDEFQDTNGAQNAILKAWASYDKKPNLCVVGDDDQSIYRFQGASLANILEFKESYEGVKIVTLTQNYRSTQKILDASRSLIEKNVERLVNKIEGLSKVLEANPQPSPDPSLNREGSSALPKIVEVGSEMDEASFVVEEIEKLLKQKVPANEIAVLYRNRSHGSIVADLLRQKGIHFFRADGQNALQDKRVQQLISLLKLIENPADGVSLLSVLFADFVDVADVEVYRTAKIIDRYKSLLDIFSGAQTPPTPLVRGEPAEELPDSVKKFSEKLLGWQKLKSEQNLLELVENIAAESGLTQKMNEKDEFEAAEALSAFLIFVRKFTVNREQADLKNLLSDLENMQRQNIALPLPIRPHASVTLTTAHRAKGLEWGHVFIVRATDEVWGGKAKREMLTLPASLVPSTGSGQAGGEHLIEDERRLFYVAMTRAKTSLTVSFASSYEFREEAPSRFIAEIEEGFVRRSVKEGGADVLPNPPLAPPLSRGGMDEESKKFLASLVEEFRLSPTALNNYLACPRKFLLQSLLRLPTAESPDDRAGAIFGIAVHAGFEEFFREFKKTGKLPDYEIAITALHKSLDREPLTKVQRERIEKDAISALKKYLDFYAEKLVVPVDVEYNFAKHDVHLDDIPLTGKVDRIDPITNTKSDVSFVDYKSQKPYSRAAIKGETANSTGDAYRQLLFYLLLAELDNRFIFKPKEVTLSFVRENDAGEFKDEAFAPTKEEVDELKKLIRETYSEIRELKFDCTDDKNDCRKCRYKGICERSEVRSMRYEVNA